MTAPRPTTASIRLSDLAALVGATTDAGAVTVTGITLDSHDVHPGDLFCALPGRHHHGAEFIEQARAAGAVAVLIDPEAVDRVGDLPALVVERPRAHVGELAAAVYGRPANRLQVLAITGTNGKTTTSWMVQAGLVAAGRRTGMIGTLGAWIDGEHIPLARTTPEATDLHALLGVMVERGVEAVVMEASSVALVEGRMDGLVVDVAAFTHLTQDHLDYHGTMEAYFDAKAMLFDRARRAVIGVDDEWGRRLCDLVAIPVTTWSRRDPTADWSATESGHEVRQRDGQAWQLTVPIPGDFNIANAVCAIAMLDSAGVDASAAVTGIAHVQVPGRMQRVGSGVVVGLVDYAHTPDAVIRALTASRQAAPGRVIAVLGAGGDRDRAKRPLMGQAAGRLADVVVVTDDNPRSEEPASIRREVAAGIPAGVEVHEVGDRAEAINRAVRLAEPGDVVVVLGKGHEQGQEVAGTVHPFDDAAVLTSALQRRSGHA